MEASTQRKSSLVLKKELGVWLEEKAGLTGKKLAVSMRACDEGMVESLKDLRTLYREGEIEKLLPTMLVLLVRAALEKEAKEADIDFVQAVLGPPVSSLQATNPSPKQDGSVSAFKTVELGANSARASSPDIVIETSTGSKSVQPQPVTPIEPSLGAVLETKSCVSSPQAKTIESVATSTVFELQKTQSIKLKKQPSKQKIAASSEANAIKLAATSNAAGSKKTRSIKLSKAPKTAVQSNPTKITSPKEETRTSPNWKVKQNTTNENGRKEDGDNNNNEAEEEEKEDEAPAMLEEPYSPVDSNCLVQLEWCPQQVVMFLKDIGVSIATQRLAELHKIDGVLLALLATDRFEDGLGALLIHDIFTRAKIRVAALEAGTKAREEFNDVTLLGRKPDKNPTNEDRYTVEVGYRIESISDVDCLKSMFRCQFHLCASWYDPALEGCSQEYADQLQIQMTNESPPMDIVDWRKEGLREPHLIIMNARKLDLDFFLLKVRNRRNGQVRWAKHFNGWLEIDVSDSLKDFPFDFADLRICIRPRTLTWDKVKLDIWQGGQFLNIPHEASKNLDLLGSNRFAPKKTEWKLVGHRVELLKNDPRIYESSKAVIQSEYHILIMMQRDSSWYIWNVMLLEFMMVVLTILAMIFPLEPPPAPAKGATAASLPSSHMQVAITVLLALIMTQFGMKRHTPRVKEATFLEHYANLSVGTVIAFIFYTAIFEWLQAKTGHAAMTDSDKAAKLTIAVVFVVIWLLCHVQLAIRLGGIVSGRKAWKEKSLIPIVPLQPVLRPEL